MSYTPEDIEKIKGIDWDLENIMVEYDEWVKKTNMFGRKTIIAFIIIFIAIFFLTDDWIRIVVAVFVVKGLLEISKRDGHREGYIYGYQDGCGAGVNKTFGISDEMSDFIDEVNMDRKIS